MKLCVLEGASVVNRKLLVGKASEVHVAQELERAVERHSQPQNVNSCSPDSCGNGIVI